MPHPSPPIQRRRYIDNSPHLLLGTVLTINTRVTSIGQESQTRLVGDSEASGNESNGQRDHSTWTMSDVEKGPWWEVRKPPKT